MDTISLTQDVSQNITILSNEFIDHYMIEADGEYVKIYLLIQRLSGDNILVTVDQLADKLELTRKDVLRAVRYWKKKGLLTMPSGSEDAVAKAKTKGQPDISQRESKQQTAPPERIQEHFSLVKEPLPRKRTRNASELSGYISGTDLERLVFMAETYIGHPLSVSELNSICYISDDLKFPIDLLEYLVEYCTEKGKKQIRYMEKVAINWYEQGINTVKKAIDQSALYTQNVFTVMKAFGISGRNPGQSEIDYINRWNSMGFENDIIIEACNRTLLTTHQASFPYANRILEDWKKAGVKNMTDIRLIDQKYHAGSRPGNEKDAPKATKRIAANAFHNFEQRSYDYEDLELRLAGKSRR